MAYTALPVEQFGGLNLNGDPGEIGWNGAVDLLNVDFIRRGRVGSRPGYTLFASAANAYSRVFSYPSSGSAGLFMAVRSNGTLDAIDSTGTVTGSKIPGGAQNSELNAQLHGTPSTTAMYVAGGLFAMQKWNGAFSDVAAAPKSNLVGLMPISNRLVAAHITTPANIWRVQFSAAGDATTWGANDWVDLRPGTGVGGGQPFYGVTALTNWRDLLFAFTPEAIFVFYGESVDSTGNPIFNVRALDDRGVGGCATYNAVASSPRGVYFVARDGIYLTTGSGLQKISGALDPIFRAEAGALPYFGGATAFGAPQRTSSSSDGLYWWKEKLFYSRSDNTDTARYTFVYDEASDAWSLWNAPFGPAITASRTFGGLYDPDALYFPIYGSTGIGKMDFASRATTDNGTAITSRYRSGFNTAPPGNRPDGRRVIRQWHLDGTGTVTFGVAADKATAIPISGGGAELAVSLGQPMPNYRISQQGRNFSWQVRSTGAWHLDSVQADLT